MTELFRRRCVVVLDGREIDGLRVSFKVKKTSGKEPNTAEVNIANLSATSRAAMAKKHAKLILQAGFEESIATIFSGDARTVDHVRDGASWVTKALAGDGERAYQYSRCSESFGPGTRASDVILYLSRALGINPGNALEKANALPKGSVAAFANGISVHGKAATELDRVLRAVGFEWSIQDGALQILEEGETNRRQIVLLSPSSGLLGSPVHGTPDKKGKPAMLKVKALLQPTLRPGDRVRIEAEATNGQFRIVSLSHSGDTAGGDWFTELECLPG